MSAYLKKVTTDVASKQLDILLREINCLMSKLKLKRGRKLKQLISYEFNWSNLEMSCLNLFGFFNDIVYVKASFKSPNVSNRRKNRQNKNLNSVENLISDENLESAENLNREVNRTNAVNNDSDDNRKSVDSNINENTNNVEILVNDENLDNVDNLNSDENRNNVENRISEDNVNSEENPVRTINSESERLTGKFVSNNVVNLSKKVLTESEISVLSKGLKFSPTPKELDRSQLKQDLEAFGRRLRLRWFYREEDDAPEISIKSFKVPSKFNPKNVDAAIEIYLSHLEEKIMSIQSQGSNYSNLPVSEQEALRNLSSDRSIVIKPADKGSGVVVWDREDYLREAGSQLSNQEVYEECKSDPLPGLQKLISTVLNDLKLKKEIDGKTLEYLMINDPKLGKFYLLPKIHKRLHAVPGRPVISNCGYVTERISAFLDFHLQPLAKQVKSYIKDTNDFLCKLKDLPPLPDDAILCTIDVVGLYPSIPHDQGLEAMKKALEGRMDKSVSTESLVKLADIVLKNNFFEHDSKIFHQKQGTAIGTKFAPSYAILFMGDFEEQALDGYHLKPWVWWRYIDDIFLVWEHGEESLMEFIEYLNSIHPSIKFTSKFSRESIEFLDVLVIREGQDIQTDLFVKETDTHQFLHFSSCHPFHTKKGIPYSQALRMRRICSSDTFFDKRISDLKNWLYGRGYKKEIVDSQIERVNSLDRDQALVGNSRQNQYGGREVFSTTFHPALSNKIYEILKEAQIILQADEEHKKLFPSIPLVSFRRAKTLQDTLVRAKLPSLESQGGSCQGCNRSNCQVDAFLDTSETFSNSDQSRTFQLRKGALNCNTKFVVYRLSCKTCNMQYIGSAKTPFRKRINNYKSQFRAYCNQKNVGTVHSKVVPQGSLFEHFLQDNHHGMSDWKFQLIDRSYNEEQLRKRESFWQYKLETFVPKGLNERTVPT